MKIVIDIDEQRYEEIKRIANAQFELTNKTEAQIIASGTVLPEGHGDLIDRDALNLDYEVSMADDWKTAHEIANCVKYAPTVIGADKENKE